MGNHVWRLTKSSSEWPAEGAPRSWDQATYSTPFIYPISGANILVGAFTVTVIAIDRWKSVANTNPNSAPLNYTRAFAVIAAVWLLAFLGEKTVPSLLII